MMLARVAAASRPVVLVATALSLAGHALGAQQRRLEWPVVAIEAHLDGEGRLRVRERQVMRFSGDWNGGERRYAVGHGQRFEFLGASRIDTATGQLTAMRKGDLSVVDGYDFADGSTLRWRARRPEDPLFDRDERAYLFEYVYSQIIEPPADGDSTYLLSHDFAFADRESDIVRFTLALTIDDAWRVAPGFTGRYERAEIPPSDGFVVTLPLRWAGAGRPAGVDFGADPRLRYALALLLLMPVLPLAVRLIRREQALGRFVPPPRAEDVDEAWLRQHVLGLPPEVVGHAWDDRTGEAEVAATLARLVQQGKLASTVHRRGRGLFARDVLELRLNTPRAQLTGHARTLVDALFLSGDVTDTDAVRRHYKSSGFDPAALIRKPLAALVDATAGTGTALPKPSPWPSLLLFLAAVATFVTAVVRRPQDVPFTIAGGAALVACYVFSLVGAAFWQRRVRALGSGALFWVLPLAVVAGALTWQLVTGRFRVGAPALASLTLLCLTFMHSVMNMAMARQSAERIAMRKRLIAARDFFRRELRKEQPALRDEWFAYLVAFGLGRHIDRWFRAFGGDAVRATGVISSGSVGGSVGGSSGSGGGWTGFGGGGGFSGGGSSASFAAAVGGMASSISAPSSSGSSGGGGGGGGGSSGGGGGGGW